MEATNPLLLQTRRHFFRDCAVGLGSVALASMIGERKLAAAESAPVVNPLAAKPPHFAPKAKSVIYLFMAGGPSQLELFDYKHTLTPLNGKPIPESYIKGKRFAFMDMFTKEVPKLLGTRRKFARRGQSGQLVSDCLPHIAGIVDDIAIIRSMATNVFNHGPAKLFTNTGSAQFGRPSMGSWVTYGIGSESQNLPGFVVLQSGPRGPRGGAGLWSGGFLPTAYQGVPFRSGGDPILDLSNPPGVTERSQAGILDAIRDVNLARGEETGDPEITTRIAAYEMAYRMQSSRPDVIVFAKSSPKPRGM